MATKLGDGSALLTQRRNCSNKDRFRHRPRLIETGETTRMADAGFGCRPRQLVG